MPIRAAAFGPLFALLLGSVFALLGQGPTASGPAFGVSAIALFAGAEVPQLGLTDLEPAPAAAEVREGTSEGEGEGHRRSEAVDDGTGRAIAPRQGRTAAPWDLDALTWGDLSASVVELSPCDQPAPRRYAHAPAPARAPPQGSLTA